MCPRNAKLGYHTCSVGGYGCQVGTFLGRGGPSFPRGDAITPAILYTMMLVACSVVSPSAGASGYGRDRARLSKLCKQSIFGLAAAC